MRTFILYLPALLLLSQIGGCAPVAFPDLPAGIDIKVLGRQAGVHILSWSPDGRWLAVAGQGLDLFDAGSNEKRHLLDEQVSAVAWHDDGEVLDVATGDGFSSTLQRIWVASGQKQVVAVGNGYAAGLVWSEGRLLLVEASLKVYRFGGALKLLLRAPEDPAFKIQTLYENTLPPQTAGWLEKNPSILGGVRLSRAGDMLAYLLFKDPPAFPPSQQLIIRHLDSGRQWPVADLVLPAGRPAFSPDGENLWVSDGRGSIWNLKTWTMDMKPAGSERGLVTSGAGEGEVSLLAGGLHMQGQKTDLPVQVSAADFDPSGLRLAWIRSGQVEILNGWPESGASAVSPGTASRLVRLREWRARGLVDAEEYRTQRQRILNR